MDCLFASFSNNCAGERNEHLIQQCLGGNLASSEVICKECNEYFAPQIDESICKTFRPIMIYLAPLMGAKYMDKQYPTTSSADGRPLLLHSGGRVGLRKAHVTLAADGSAIEAWAPTDEVARQIAKKHFANPIIIKQPVCKFGERASNPTQLDLGQKTHQAVYKIMLEVLDHFSKKKNNSSIARLAGLEEARGFARAGIARRLFRTHRFPAYPLTDEMNDIFGSHDVLSFANRVIISYDAAAKMMLGLVQIAQTMPLGGPLAYDLSLSEGSFSLIFDMPITDKRGEWIIRWEKVPVVSANVFNWARFSVNTRASVDFAFSKWRNVYQERYSHAVVMSHLRTREMLSGLQTVATHFVKNLKVPVSRCVSDTIISVLQNHYEALPDSYWGKLRTELELFSSRHFSVSRINEQLIANETFGEDADKVLELFRSMLMKIIDEVGYPILA